MNFLYRLIVDSVVLKNRILKYLFKIPDINMPDMTKNMTRTIFTKNETLHISSFTMLNVQQINAEAKAIIKPFVNNIEGLLKYIGQNNTPVIRALNARKILFLFGEDEGFILPQKGIKAILLSIMINITSSQLIKVGFKTPAMFVLDKKPVSVYFMAHQLHHWMAYRKGLPGYDVKTAKNFKNIWNPEFGDVAINKMSITEILSLKDSIARDLEAIKFVKEISREFVGSQNFINRIKNGESLNL